MSYKSDVKKADRIQEAVDFPKVVLIDNCSACNLMCSMCDHKNVRNYRKIEIMPWKLYRKIIDEIAIENPSARVWEIFFGEPCLCRDMPKRIAYAKEKGINDVVLNSNGVLLNKDIAKAYIQAGLKSIYVGIDAASKDTYEKIRIGGDFERAKNNVLNYRALLDEYGSDDQDVFVQFVVSDINESEIEDFKKFWTTNGVNVKIRPKVSWAGLVDADNLISNSEVKRKPCYWLMQTINICTNGETALCSADPHCQVKCGNVNKKSIKEIWSDMLKEYRTMHRQRRFDELPDLCKNCKDWQSAYSEYVKGE